MKKFHIVLIVFTIFLLNACGTESSGWEFGITSVDPPNGASDVPLDQTITVTFNNDLDWDTIVLGASFDVYDTGTGDSVDGSLIQPAQDTILFIPDDGELQGNTNYTIYMAGVIEDIWGNVFGGEYTSSFTTIDVFE